MAYLGADRTPISYNLFSYCINNPIIYSDNSGHAVDLILDPLFIGWDIKNLVTNKGWKSWKNWTALGLDVVFAIVPFATGGGQIVKLADVSDKILGLVKVTVVGETMARVRTISQFFHATENLYDGFKAYDKLRGLGLGGKILAEIGGKSDNLFWLYGKLRQGYTIIDIGIDAGKISRSSSYMFEGGLMFLWKNRNVLKLIEHLLMEE